jgi:hypothetical protein
VAAGIRRPAPCARPSNSAESRGLSQMQFALRITSTSIYRTIYRGHAPRSLRSSALIAISDLTQSRSAQAPLYEHMPREVHGGANAAFVS